MSINWPPVVVGMGEVLWDLLPGGAQLGGAPTNFACHAKALGADARMVSRVGTDDLGKEARSRLAAIGLPMDCLQVDPMLPTGTVTVEVDAAGQPRYQIHENVAWDALTLEAPSRYAAQSAAAVCFGSLGQRSATSRATLQSLVAATSPDAWRIFDVNLRQHYYSREIIASSLELANVLKVNDAELPQLAELFGLFGGVDDQIRRLMERFNLRLLACTRGAQGSVLCSAEDWSDYSGRPIDVVDTVGAGDAFTAAMTMGLLLSWPLEQINERANQVASFVCTQAGAIPKLPDSIRALFRRP